MKNKFHLFLLVAVASLALSLTGCRAYDTPEFIDIKSNETAFLIPLTGKTSDQTTLMSEAYLQKNLVATKRVQITHDWVQTGRDTNEGKYVANVKLIVVDRTPVSVTWSDSDTAHRISVESSESIGFVPGVSLTAMIDEPDAPRFLYKYAGKPLLDVVNSDVNNYIKGRFSAYFSPLTLNEAKKQKQGIFDKVFVETVDHFKPWGVTVAQLGQTDGLTYNNPEIQNTIDALATKQNAVEVAKQENLRVEIDNKTRKSVADTAAYEREMASRAFGQNQQASIAQQQLEIEKIKANAFLEWAKAGGQLPAVVPEATFMASDFSKFFGMNPKK